MPFPFILFFMALLIAVEMFLCSTLLPRGTVPSNIVGAAMVSLAFGLFNVSACALAYAAVREAIKDDRSRGR